MPVPKTGPGREMLQKHVDDRSEIRHAMSEARTTEEYDWLHAMHTSEQAQVTNLRRQLKRGTWTQNGPRIFGGVDLPGAAQAEPETEAETPASKR